LKSRQLSALELTNAFLDRIEAVDSQIHSFILVTREEALRQAKAVDREISLGGYRGPLHGIPVGLKDLIETAGIRTTAHSKVLIDHIPAEDATVVSRLKDAGVILLGKFGCLEFAHGSPSSDQAWPAVRTEGSSHRQPDHVSSLLLSNRLGDRIP
jgi:aspartyl-tRNA(Asn)/glutamyl-tRNA(Gln) amidotransferase subunit A